MIQHSTVFNFIKKKYNEKYKNTKIIRLSNFRVENLNLNEQNKKQKNQSEKKKKKK